MGGLGTALGYMFAGAAEGAGAGMFASAKSAEEERREIALENLRSQNQITETNNQYRRSDENAAAQTDRQTDATIQINRTQADITAKRDKTQHGYAIDLAGFNSGLALAEMREQAKINDGSAATAAANTAAAAEAERKYKDGRYTKIIKGGDGFYYGVTPAGQHKKINVAVPVEPAKKGKGGTTGDLVDNLKGEGGSSPARTPAPKPKPAPKPNNASAVRYDASGQAYVQGPDGNPRRAPQYDRK